MNVKLITISVNWMWKQRNYHRVAIIIELISSKYIASSICQWVHNNHWVMKDLRNTIKKLSHFRMLVINLYDLWWIIKKWLHLFLGAKVGHVVIQSARSLSENCATLGLTVFPLSSFTLTERSPLSVLISPMLSIFAAPLSADTAACRMVSASETKDELFQAMEMAYSTTRHIRGNLIVMTPIECHETKFKKAT